MTSAGSEQLRTRQHEHGASFAEPDSNQADHFGDAASEYEKACESAVVFDLVDRTVIEITGADRATFLHGFCTNDIKKLAAGDGCEAFITNIKGRVLGHVFVRSAVDSLWLTTVPGAAETIVPHLDRYIITEDVQLHDRSPETHCFFISGPTAIETLKVIGWDVATLKANQHTAVGIGSSHSDADEVATVMICRRDWLGAAGFELVVPEEIAAVAWDAIVGSGIAPAGGNAFETLRIESRFPVYEADISEENLVQEVGRTNEAVSFTKGCYLGQEPVARIDALGHVNRQLVRLEVEKDDAIPSDDIIGRELIDADSKKAIGRITSAIDACQSGNRIALAYLRTQHIKPGNVVTLQIADEKTLTARVVLPD